MNRSLGYWLILIGFSWFFWAWLIAAIGLLVYAHNHWLSIEWAWRYKPGFRICIYLLIAAPLFWFRRPLYRFLSGIGSP